MVLIFPGSGVGVSRCFSFLYSSCHMYDSERTVNIPGTMHEALSVLERSTEQTTSEYNATPAHEVVWGAGGGGLSYPTNHTCTYSMPVFFWRAWLRHGPEEEDLMAII